MIDLKQYIPQKAKKTYLLKIIFYVLFLGLLLYFVVNAIQEKSANDPVEVKGVKIDVQTKGV